MTVLFNKLIAFFLIPLFLIFPKYSLAKTKNIPQVLIINQVRGSECCGKGTTDNLNFQINNAINFNLPTYFSLRYDALIDKNYYSLIKKYSLEKPSIIKPAIFLEITPELARMTGATYLGTNDRWYEAQNVYSIGYNDKDNRKIVDIVFSQFYQIFGKYPEVTTGWMIDSDLLNYINEKYAVQIHQITREQWGTDSYTLYGGPPHYPFPPSKNWSLIPDYSLDRNLLIVRQTVTDPLYNYGDKTNSFTSQPNDYTLDGKDIKYFKNILNQALFKQINTGFALVGLETSMSKKYQEEYFKQLEYLSKLVNERKASIVNANDLMNTWKTIKINLYKGDDFINSTKNKAFWINSENYRVRLIIKNNDLYISDIRVFDKNFTDPYLNYQAKKEGYWIIPALFDSSMKTQKGIDLKKINIERINDFSNAAQLIRIAKNIKNEEFKYQKEGHSIIFVIDNDSELSKKIIFNLNDIEFKNFKENDFILPELSESVPIKLEQDNYIKLKWQIEDSYLLFSKIKCTNRDCVMNFYTNYTLIDNARKAQYPFIFPEPIKHPIDIKRSSVKLNNRFAVANRNPARIVIIPLDSFGNFTNLPLNNVEVNGNKNIRVEKSTYDNFYFIDLYSNSPRSDIFEIKINGEQIFKDRLFFSPNCKIELEYCLKNPIELTWYILSIIGDKFREVSEKINKNIY